MKFNVILFLLILVLSSCDDDNELEGNWKQVGSIENFAITGGLSFKIGSKVFVGLGYNQDKMANRKFYSSEDGITWDTISSFPGQGRVNAVSFVLENKAYVGLGYVLTAPNQPIESYKDFYCYDNSTQKWSKLETPYPGDGYQDGSGIGFTLNNTSGKEVGYAGKNDIYSFDGLDWKKENISVENNSYSFVIKNMAYIFTINHDVNGFNFKMIYFDGKTATPELLKDPGYGSAEFNWIDAVTFIAKIDGQERGYVTGGCRDKNSELVKNCMEFNPVTKNWQRVSAMPELMPSRRNAVGFTINDCGYVYGGSFSTLNNKIGEYYNVWQFRP